MATSIKDKVKKSVMPVVRVELPMASIKKAIFVLPTVIPLPKLPFVNELAVHSVLEYMTAGEVNISVLVFLPLRRQKNCGAGEVIFTDWALKPSSHLRHNGMTVKPIAPKLLGNIIPSAISVSGVASTPSLPPGVPFTYTFK